MIYTPLTNKAACLAYEAHQGQFDTSGLPYIFHPYHVAEQMTDEVTTCVALLHDVVEDTDVSISDLEGMFPEEVVEAVRLMTHDDGSPYMEYLARVKANPVARAVKIADIRHNADETRLTGCTVPQEKVLRWREKYAMALRFMEE